MLHSWCALNYPGTNMRCCVLLLPLLLLLLLLL